MAARVGCTVVASDESSAMLVALAGMVEKRRVPFFPALDAGAPGMGDAAERFREDEAVLAEVFADAAARHVSLEHRDFTAAEGGPAGDFDAVATLFVLDCVASLPAAVAAVARALRPGGVWVNCGPLRKHRESRPWSFRDIVVLAEAAGLTVVEDSRFPDCDYVPREVALGAREIYDVQLLVAQKGFLCEGPGATDHAFPKMDQ